MSEQAKMEAGNYEILLRERQGRVLAALKPIGDDPQLPTRDTLLKALADNGFGELHLLEEGIEQLLTPPPEPEPEPEADADADADAEIEPPTLHSEASAEHEAIDPDEESVEAESDEEDAISIDKRSDEQETAPDNEASINEQPAEEITEATDTKTPPPTTADLDDEDFEEFEVAERVDGEALVSTDEDEMSATLTITPAAGGKQIAMLDVELALKQQEINFGIDIDTIKNALTEGECEALLIAEGTPPIDGDDSQFVTLTPDIHRRGPKIREDGTVDYRDLNIIITVSRGDKLMRRDPPTAGTPGTNIKGLSIRPAAGKEIPYDACLDGVEISTEDPDILLATIGGQPILVDHGVNVEPVLTVKTIDLSTGNVDFDGNIAVEGDVAPLMHLKASGDIVVSGMCEAAALEAGGDIHIAKGVIGHQKPEQEIDNQAEQDDHEFIRCNGTIHTRFIENYRVTAGTSVVVDELIAHSEVSAGNEVIVGNDKSKRGNILGGRTRANNRIVAKNIGSSANPHTEIEVGFAPDTKRSYEALSDLLSSKLEEKHKLVTIINYLTNNKTPQTDNRFVQVKKAYNKVRGEISSLAKMQKEILDKVKGCEKASVDVSQHTFSGAHLIIAGHPLMVQDEKGAGNFHIEDGEIAFP